MKKVIEFQICKPGELDLISPLQPSNHVPYQDLILKPEYSGLKYTLPKGTSTFRILPPIGGGYWKANIDAYDHDHGRHADPSFADSAAISVFDIARNWLRRHQPDALYSKTTPEGHKLWTSKLFACWILIDGPEPPELRLLIASAFAGGARSVAPPGLGHQIMHLVSQNKRMMEPDQGYQVKVTRSYSADSKFPKTELSLHHSMVPINDCIGELSPEDLNRLCPIRDTVRQISPADEWALLAKVIGDELAQTIQAQAAEI